MKDEYGSQLFLSTFVSLFADTNLILWCYPVIAFIYSSGVRRSKVGNVLKNILSDAKELNESLVWHQFPKTFVINILISVVVLIIFLALAFTNGLMIVVIALALNYLGLLIELNGIEKIALVTGLFVFLGLITERVKSETPT